MHAIWSRAATTESSPPISSQVEPGLADQIAQLSDMLRQSKRPFVIAGGGGWTPAAVANLRLFAERNALPVGVSFRNQDVFDNNHPNYAIRPPRSGVRYTRPVYQP